MDLHARYINVPTPGLSILTDILGNEGPSKQLSRDTMKSIVAKNQDRIVEGGPNIENLELYRLVLCYVYQISAQEGTHLPIDLEEVRMANLESILFLGRTSPSRSKDEFRVLLDIATLQLLLFKGSRAILECLKRFQGSTGLYLPENREKRTSCLKTMERFLDIFVLRRDMSSMEGVGEVFLSCLEYIKLWFEVREDDSEWRSVVALLSKLVKLNPGRVLAPVWNLLLTRFSSLKSTLAALCIAFDIFFSAKTEIVENSLYELCVDERYWTLLLEGVASPISEYRKQALYLVQRTIDFMNTPEIRERVSVLLERNTIVPFVCKAKYARATSVEHIRENFFLILEALEEKQKHLVTPVLSLIITLINGNLEHQTCGNCFPDVWLRCVFERVLQHENNAVVKQGLLRAFQSNLAIFDGRFLLLLAKVLNCSHLYELKNDERQPEVAKELAALFTRADGQRTDLRGNFVLKMCEILWGPVALYYVTEALGTTLTHDLSRCLWNNDHFRAIKWLGHITLSKHCQTMCIGSQIELLEVLAHFTIAREHCDLTSLADTLSTFSYGGILARGSRHRLRISIWLNRVVSEADAASFVKSFCESLSNEEPELRISIQSFSCAVVLLYHAELILSHGRTCPAEIALTNLLSSSLIEADARLYASPVSRIRSIELINSLLDYCTMDCSVAIDRLVLPYIDAVLKFICKTIRRTSLLIGYGDMIQYLSALQTIFTRGYSLISRACLSDYLDELEKECLYVLENANAYYGIQRLYVLRILCLKQYIFAEWPKRRVYMDLLLDTYALELNSEVNEARVRNDRMMLKGRIASEYYMYTACLIHKFLVKTSGDSDYLVTRDWLEHNSRLLVIGGQDIIATVVAISKEIVEKHLFDESDLPKLTSIIQTCQRLIFQSKKTQLFWKATKRLIELTLSSSFLAIEACGELVTEIVARILEEGSKVPRLRRMLVENMKVSHTRTLRSFSKVILTCLLHGTAPRRDQWIEMQACTRVIEKHGRYYCNLFSITNHNIDATVRAQSVKLLHEIIATDPKFAATLCPLLIAKLEEYKSKRYFGDSNIHRMKHRIMQTLLILQPALDETCTLVLYDLICNLTLLESNQHSVRYMQEWLLIRMCVNDESLRTRIWDLLEQANVTRPGSLSSIISVIYHISQLLPREPQYEFLEKAISHIAPGCMGQQFNVRLYSQVILVKLYETAVQRNFADITTNCKALYNAALESLRYGNLMKNADKMKEDFYFTVFHPQNDYSLQTIYYELPRLSNVSADEWITPATFQLLEFEERIAHHPLKFLNPSQSLSAAQVSTHVSKPLSGGQGATSDVDGSIDGSKDIQKKITPWKLITPSEDELLEISTVSISRRQLSPKHDGIIIVASLIDRPPNLGGLARTCEIFGAMEFVISSLKYIEDKQFQSLSVSAERWIPVVEVKPHQLPKYLSEKKDAGWTLVGVEQTANSINLLNTKFERKTILLLGNEKDGIPANLIPLMDVCVEIPQVGIVRSLNVHVTGAICLWQYSMQHTFK